MKFEMEDRSHETFGKYQYGTDYLGYEWADSDFSGGDGCGFLKWGVKSAPDFFGENKKRIRYIPFICEIKYFLGML